MAHFVANWILFHVKKDWADAPALAPAAGVYSQGAEAKKCLCQNCHNFFIFWDIAEILFSPVS